MNRPNGARFHSRGSSSGRGRDMTGRRGPPYVPGPLHHSGTMQHGQPIIANPPGSGGVSIRAPAANISNGAGMHLQMHRGFIPPPPIAVGRQLHPHPPPPLRHPNPTDRRFMQGQTSHQNQQQSRHVNPYRNDNMNPRMAQSPVPPSLHAQHLPFPPMMNGGMQTLPVVNNPIPPPPPHPLQHFQQYNPHQSHVHRVGPNGPPQTQPPMIDPRVRNPTIPVNDVNQYSNHRQQHNYQIPSLAGATQGSSQPIPSPSSLSTSFTQQQIDDAWTEHVAPNGTSYYHNNILKKSTYDKPDVLKAKETKAVIVTTKIGNPWQQYSDANTGKSYYSNGVTTTWEKPEGFEISKTVDDPVIAEPPKKKKKAITSEIKFSSKEEAIAAFKGLLLAKEISPSGKWNDVSKLCSTDAKWEACEAALTTGERKQALAEYQTKRANDLRASERQEKIRAKEAFMQLLNEKLSDDSGFSAWTSRFEDVREGLSKDDRFHAVANEPSRESLFLDFCEEFKKREERKKRSKKREAQDVFDAFLLEQEENGLLTFASTWSSFIAALNEKNIKDPRFEISIFMSDSDRQLYFADHVIKLQKAEDDKRNRIRGARHRAEKAQREAFLDDLHELSRVGKIVPNSRWRSIEAIVASIPSYVPVADQDTEAPRDIFEEFMGNWNESYRRDIALLSQLVYPPSGAHIAVTQSTTYEEFCKALLDAADDSPEMYRQARKIMNRVEPVSSARLYFQELALEYKDVNTPILPRRGSLQRRRAEESSEDEGEIVEEE